MSLVDGRGNVHHGGGSPAGGQFAGKVNAAPAGGLSEDSRDLTVEEPPGIDSELAELYNRAFTARLKAEQMDSEIARYERYIERESQFPARVADYQRTIERYEAKRDEHLAEADAAEAESVPLEAEFRRRGGWTRAFLATSANGHVHSSMGCSTCNKSGRITRFAWMTDYSGADEAAIVEAAGERACTTCFPSAPVDVLSRPTKMFSDEEKEAAAVREERAAEKARKAAIAAEKAIANPDGTPLRHGYREARTLVTAERELTDTLLCQIVNERRPGHYGNPNFIADQAEWQDMLLAAIAAKKGISVDEVRAAGRAKAEAKFKREWGDSRVS